MKKTFVISALMSLLAITACGGGSSSGGGGSMSIPTIAYLSPSSGAAPMEKLTITGAGFDDATTLKVRFFDGNGYTLEVPATAESSSSITVAVPPYINFATGEFEAGTVDVLVIKNSTESNTRADFQISALPVLTLTPGDVTANVAGFMELALTDTIDGLSELYISSGGQINTIDLCNRLESIRQQYSQFKNTLRDAIADPNQAGTIVQINGTDITLDQQSLQLADQLMTAVIDGIYSELQNISVQSVSSSPAKTYILGTGCTQDQDSELCHLEKTLTGYKSVANNEQLSSQEYLQALVPTARDTFSDIMKWVGATTATIGAVTVAAGASIPLAGVAAITQLNVTGMVTLFGIDAARLSADSGDKDAAEDLLEDFNSTLEYLRDSVLSPTISAISEKAGIAYDLFMGWKPVFEDSIPTLLSELNTVIDQAETGVTGSWSGTLTNPNLGISGCEGGTTSIYITLEEGLFMSITGTVFGTVDLSGTRSGNAMTITEDNTRFGARGPYSWTWDGGDTITGSVAYFCWDLDSGTLIKQGTGTFTATRY